MSEFIEDFGKMFNMNYISRSNVSISQALLIFYVLIASHFTNDLFAKQFKKFLSGNRIAQHVIGFITMLIIIINVAGIQDTKPAILYSLIAYVWFIFTTKLDLQWNMIIILLLLFGFLYENQLAKKEKSSATDKALTSEDIKNIENKHNRYKTYLVISVMLITLTGTILYANKKWIQYDGENQSGGGQFDLIKFFLY